MQGARRRKAQPPHPFVLVSHEQQAKKYKTPALRSQMDFVPRASILKEGQREGKTLEKRGARCPLLISSLSWPFSAMFSQ